MAATSATLLVIGSYSQPAGHVKGELGEGLCTFWADAEGRLTPTGETLPLPSPTYVASHPRLPVCYAALEVMSVDGEEGRSEVLALCVDRASGGLSILSRVKLPAPIACYVECDGARLFLAMYWPNTRNETYVCAMSLREDGSLDQLFPWPAISTPASGAAGDRARGGFDPGRQETSHPHCSAAFHFAGQHWLLVPDLGCDVVHRFAVRTSSEAGLTLVPCGEVRFPTGSGPRHCTVDGEAGVAYVVAELASKVFVVRLDTLELSQEASTLPEDVNGMEIGNWCAAIKLSPDRKTLYVSNRGHNTIVAFRLEAGALREPRWCGAGTTPRDFYVDPAGRYVLAFGQDSGTIARLAVAADGSLSETGDVLKLGAPVTCARL